MCGTTGGNPNIPESNLRCIMKRNIIYQLMTAPWHAMALTLCNLHCHSMATEAKESPSATKAMYYTYDTFQNMKTRAKAIRDYLDVLREQYEKEHGELVRDGVICAEPCSQNLPWEQVVAQAPRFFELRHQGMKDPSRSSFGIFVLQEMHKCLMKSKGFPTLLSEISSSGILVLPGPALGP